MCEQKPAPPILKDGTLHHIQDGPDGQHCLLDCEACAASSAARPMTDAERDVVRRLKTLALHEALAMQNAEALRIARWLDITLEDGWLPASTRS